MQMTLFFRWPRPRGFRQGNPWCHRQLHKDLFIVFLHFWSAMLLSIFLCHISLCPTHNETESSQLYFSCLASAASLDESLLSLFLSS